MKIKILTDIKDARTYEFDVEQSTTPKTLKEMLRDRMRLDEHNTRGFYLFYNGDRLDNDNEILQCYGIEDGSVLQLKDFGVKARSHGGIGILGTKFVDISDQKNVMVHQWSTSAPAWRVARSGLCFEGKCTNKSCDAYDRSVIIPIGFKKFNVLTDESAETTACPLCRKFVHPTNCAFNNCWWRFEGIKVNSESACQPPIPCSSEWTNIGNEYHYFQSESSGLVNWRQLIIETSISKPDSF